MFSRSGRDDALAERQVLEDLHRRGVLGDVRLQRDVERIDVIVDAVPPDWAR